MTNNDIIKLARKAGFIVWSSGPRKGLVDWASEYDQDLARFAALIATHEREACAKVVESYTGAWNDQGYALAQAIRARGNT